MPTATITTALNSTLFGHYSIPPCSPPTRAPLPPPLVTIRARRPHSSRRSGRVSCEAAVTTAEVSSPSTSDAASTSASEAELEEASRVGARVRVKVPLKVHHVIKVHELDLDGMEGKIKDYVGLWKGNRISANLPFKVEFVAPDGVDGRPGPLKFVAHLKEDEFDYLPQD